MLFKFVLLKGSIIAKGTFHELADSNLDITNFIHVEEETETKKKTKDKEEVSRRLSTISTAVSINI